MKIQKLLIVLITVLAVSMLAACAVQPAAITQAPAAETDTPAAAQQDVATEPAEAASATLTSAPTATALPTATLMPTATADTSTGEFAAFTEAPAVAGSSVFISLPQNTICRLGPATVYQSVASFTAGTRLQAVGRLLNDETYYFVQNPNLPDTHCWIYGQGASIEGNPAELDIIEPLPSPTPDTHANFSITYSHIKQCGDDYSFSFKVENTDDTVWQSIKVYILDLNKKITATYSSNRFEEYSDCHLDNVQGDLTKGERVFMTPFDPGHFDYRPYGGKFLLRVTLCTAKDFAGDCLTKEITVRP